MIELVLYDKDGNEKRLQREDTSLLELEKFLELRETTNKGIREKTLTELDLYKKQINFIYEIFKSEVESREALMAGMRSATFGEDFDNLCRQISPSHFKKRESKADDAGGSKKESK